MAIKSTKLFTNLNRWPQKVFQTFLMNNVYRQCCLSLHYDCTSEAIRPLLICIDISNNHKTKKVFLQCCRRMIKTFTVPEELSERSPSRRWRKHSPSRRKNSPSRSRRKETHQAVRGNKTHQAGGGGVEAAPFSEATSSGHPEQELSFSFPTKDLMHFPESNLNLIPSMGMLRCGRDWVSTSRVNASE